MGSEGRRRRRDDRHEILISDVRSSVRALELGQERPRLGRFDPSYKSQSHALEIDMLCKWIDTANQLYENMVSRDRWSWSEVREKHPQRPRKK